MWQMTDDAMWQMRSHKYDTWSCDKYNLTNAMWHMQCDKCNCEKCNVTNVWCENTMWQMQCDKCNMTNAIWWMQCEQGLISQN